jgi:cytochrome b561
MTENIKVSRQRLGGIASIGSAVLLVIVMFLMQTFAMKGIAGEDIYEKTVNSLAAYPILNWAGMLIGVCAIILLFWTIEAVDERLRSGYQQMSSNVSRFAYFHLLTYALYMILPAAVLHDLANKDKNISEALQVIHPITELGLVLSVLSSIFLSLWLLQVGYLILKTKTFSKALGVFSLIISCIVLVSGCYEALYGRGTIFGIITSILTFAGAFVIWKIWLGVELVRRN